MEKKLILVGSNSYKSINYEVAKKFQNKTKYDLIWLKDYDVPIYNLELEEKNIPTSIKAIQEKIQGYSTIILFTPEHNGYLPSFLKNIFDWLSRDFSFNKGQYFLNKKLYIVCVSLGATAGETVRQMGSKLLTYSGAKIIGNYGIGSYTSKKDITNDLDLIAKAV